MTADPVEEFEEYRSELLEKLGGRGGVEVMRSAAEDLEQLWRSATAEQLTRQASPGDWSAHETLLHLIDSELVYGVRMRMIATQDEPPLPGYDQEAWIQRFGPLESDPRESLEIWLALRRLNLRVLEALGEEEMDRVGLHSERGPESIRLIADLLGGHDLNHLDQIRSAIEGK